MLPTYFISHGGGPWPWMKDQTGNAYVQLEAALAAMPSELPSEPKAILMVTAHWEEAGFVASGASAPGMIYDYYGFPPHTYQIKYPAPGAPDLAARASDLLEAAGLPTGIDDQRGFDHGTFTAMGVMYPDANMPVVQLSLHGSLDPALHIQAGTALAPLRNEDVLIIGSGLSYHNLGEMGPQARQPSAEFDQWLQDVVTQSDPYARQQALLDWVNAPAARAAHPREEHLLPLMVAVGAAGSDAGTCSYNQKDFFGGLTVSNFQFG